MCWAPSDEGPLFRCTTKANQLRSSFYEPETEIAEVLSDGCWKRSAQEVALMLKGERRLQSNIARGATATVAEGMLIRRGEFHVWMWLEKTSARSDFLHTWSGFKNNNIRRYTEMTQNGAVKGLSQFLRLSPVGLRLKRNAAWNFSACILSCWRLTLAVRPALTGNSHGASIMVPPGINTCLWWLSIRETEVIVLRSP